MEVDKFHYFSLNTLPMNPFRWSILALSALSIACNSSSPEPEHLAMLEDGIYLIERTGATEKDVLPLAEHEQIIRFNEEFLDKTDQDDIVLVINTNDFCPLKLKLNPVTQTQEDQRKRLLLTLTDDAKKQFEEFTTRNLNRLTGIVVNGEALTKHKVKVPIVSGMVQITRCTDNACEMLFVELQDNVVGDSN